MYSEYVTRTSVVLKQAHDLPSLFQSAYRGTLLIQIHRQIGKVTKDILYRCESAIRSLAIVGNFVLIV